MLSKKFTTGGQPGLLMGMLVCFTPEVTEFESASRFGDPVFNEIVVPRFFGTASACSNVDGSGVDCVEFMQLLLDKSAGSTAKMPLRTRVLSRALLAWSFVPLV